MTDESKLASKWKPAAMKAALDAAKKGQDSAKAAAKAGDWHNAAVIGTWADREVKNGLVNDR